MKILFVTRKYPPQVGGMEQLSYYLTQRIQCQKTIIALRKPQLHLLWFMPYALLRSITAVREIDAVHLSDAALASIGFFQHRFFRKPIFVSIHGLDLTFSHRNWVYALYLRLFLDRRRWHYICNSHATENVAQQDGLCRTTVITPGVDGEARRDSLPARVQARAWLARQLNQPLDDVVVLLTVGRLVRRKGVAWFVEQVLPHLEGNIVYVIVGTGQDQVSIERAIAEKGPANRAILLGRLLPASLGLAYAAADIFVMPNIEVPGDMEGFGIAGLEAAASGLPVVASRLEGIPDAIVHERNGLLVNPSDPAAFLDTLRPLIADAVYRQALGRQAQEFAVQHYSWDRMAEGYRVYFAAHLDS